MSTGGSTIRRDYPSFEARWQVDWRYAYRPIDATAVVAEVSYGGALPAVDGVAHGPHAASAPGNVRQTRELARVPVILGAVVREIGTGGPMGDRPSMPCHA